MTPLKQVGLMVLIAGLGLGGYYGWQHYTAESQAATQPNQRPEERPVQVDLATAEMRDLSTTVEAVGSTRALRSVAITPLAAGRITAMSFEAGQQVTAGTVLFRLDDDIQRADLAEAEARVTDAASRLKRAETLQKSKTVTEATVDQITAELNIARADRDRAARRLRDRTVSAPFDGIVGFTDTALGARVEVGDVVTMLDDLSQVEIEFSLPESFFARIRAGMKIVADAAAFPSRRFDGTITSIDSRIEPVSRSFAARAVIDNPDGTLPAGMFMHIEVVLESTPGLAIPEAALVVEGSRAYVFVVTVDGEAQRVEQRDVQIGRRTFGHVEIRDGLTEGDFVVTRGVQKVRSGTLIRGKVTRADGDKDATASS